MEKYHTIGKNVGLLVSFTNTNFSSWNLTNLVCKNHSRLDQIVLCILDFTDKF